MKNWKLNIEPSDTTCYQIILTHEFYYKYDISLLITSNRINYLKLIVTDDTIMYAFDKAEEATKLLNILRNINEIDYLPKDFL